MPLTIIVDTKKDGNLDGNFLNDARTILESNNYVEIRGLELLLEVVVVHLQ